jgi:2'-5' RNA ligase
MPSHRHRLFYALRPPTPQRLAMGAHRDAIAEGQGHVSNDRIHLTLGITNDFEELPEEIAHAMIAFADSVTGPPFAISLDRLSGSLTSVALRPSRRVRELSNLHRQLDRGMMRHGIRRHAWEFNPHATLLYRKGSPFQRPVTPISWKATDFVLIHSIVGANRHIELGSWPLEAAQLSFGW